MTSLTCPQHGIVQKILAAPPENVLGVKSRLLACCDHADKESGFFNSQWREAIERLDTDPRLVLKCNQILHDMIVQALGHNALAQADAACGVSPGAMGSAAHYGGRNETD